MVKLELFRAGDVYIDDTYEDCKYRYEHATGKIFARPYGMTRENEIERSNMFWGEAVRSGTAISREEYYRDEPAPGGEKVASPWEPWTKGSWVEYRISTVAQGIESETIQKQTVSEKTPAEIVLKIEVRTIKPAAAELPATEMKVPLAAAGAGGAPKKLSQGAEIIELSGRKLACEWAEYEIDAGDSKGVTKIWTCPDVPGGTVKTASRVGNMDWTMVLIDFDGEC